MTALKLTPQTRIALFDRLAATATRRALESETHPALASYYAELAMHYDKAARRIERDLTDQISEATVSERPRKKNPIEREKG